MVNLLTMKLSSKIMLIAMSVASAQISSAEGKGEMIERMNGQDEVPVESVEASIFVEEKPEQKVEDETSGISESAENEGKVEVADESNAEPTLTEFSLVEMYGDRPEVEYWRNIYLSEKWQKVLYNILEGAVDYRVYVRKCVIERNVPRELEYLPVVESGYKTSVRSRSGAIGMWQFMANSVKPFLRLSEYIDERYDPWLSTNAGISKLQDNHKIFNDWLIAIASYNCGNGKMRKTIRKAGTSDYWELVEKKALPKQTAEYIPKLIAIADIAVNHEKYGVDLPLHDKEYEELVNEKDEIFDYVLVKNPYLISAIAKESGISEKTLKHLNPSLTKGFTPPALEYQLRLPLGEKERVESAISKVKPIEFPFQYKVEKGDSLWSISRKFGVTVQALCDTNGIKENAILRIGKILYVPSVKK